MMRRKYLFIGAVGLVVVVSVVVAALSQSMGSLTSYKFLREADTVLNERTIDPATKRLATLRVYAIHRSINEVGQVMDKELAAGGLTALFPTGPQRVWMDRSPLPGKSALPVAFKRYVAAIDGQPRVLPEGSPPASIDREHTIEGWTTIAIVEEYKPAWYDVLLDRFRSAPKATGIGYSRLQIVPGKWFKKP